jgi:hypothetical protein
MLGASSNLSDVGVVEDFCPKLRVAYYIDNSPFLVLLIFGLYTRDNQQFSTPPLRVRVNK